MAAGLVPVYVEAIDEQLDLTQYIVVVPLREFSTESKILSVLQITSASGIQRAIAVTHPVMRM
jgi:hypothetical protein